MEATNEGLRLILSRVTGADILDAGRAVWAVPRTAEEEGLCIHFQLSKGLPGTRVLGLGCELALGAIRPYVRRHGSFD